MKKVLIVDDYLDFVQCLGEFIERFNDVECLKFVSPSDALMYILNHRDVDMLITDYEMPGMNGFMLAQKLLSIHEIDIKVVVCSGHDEETLKELRKMYDLEGEVEVVHKCDMEFFKNLNI